MADAKLLSVTVQTPKGVEFSGSATAVTSKNKKGKFDVLPFHANFISIIEENVTVHQVDKREVALKLQKGVMKVQEDTVHVLIGIETAIPTT